MRIRTWNREIVFACGLALAIASPPLSRADDSQAAVAEKVNPKVVKLFGSGGFSGLVSYGTGVLVSPDGYTLTVAGHMLDTQDLRVHLSDGRRFHAKVAVIEPELDAALVKIEKAEGLPYFDIAEAAKAPLARAGDWILALSNEFNVATRDEPMSVQHGVIAAYSKLQGHKGVFDAPYSGDVYVIDAITNNPGAGGGVIVNRKGELIGIIGKELRNNLTNTWINYAVPIQVLAKFVTEGKAGKYKPIVKAKPSGGPGGYHGLVLVANVVERTPPYIEEVTPGSPGAKAGLKPDDLIVYVDGEQVLTVTAFKEILAKARPGTVIKLEIRRVDKNDAGGGDRLITVDLKLGDQPPAPGKKEGQKGKQGDKEKKEDTEKGRRGDAETKK
jgi:serine protease Do